MRFWIFEEGSSLVFARRRQLQSKIIERPPGKRARLPLEHSFSCQNVLLPVQALNVTVRSFNPLFPPNGRAKHVDAGRRRWMSMEVAQKWGDFIG